MTDKYDECPLKAAGFRLETFTELPALIIGPDGKCICTAGERCTLAQLRTLDRQAQSRRAWQSGD